MEHFADCWDYADPAASEDRLRQTAARARTDDDRAEAMTQVGRALCLQRRFDDARAALATAESLVAADSMVAARMILERGRVHRDAGDLEAATECFERALALAERHAEPYLVIDALHMLALTSDGDAQLRYHHRAIDEARATDDEHARGWLATLLNNLGEQRIARGDLAGGMELFLEQERVATTETKRRIARWQQGRTLRLMGKLREAEALLGDLLGGCGPDDPWWAWILGEHGECLWSAGNTADARAAFRCALAKLQGDSFALVGEPEWLASMRERCGDDDGS